MWSHNLKLYLIYIKINSSSHTLKVQWSQFSSFTNHVQANETRIKDGHCTRVWGVLPLHAGVKGPVWCQSSFQSPCRASTEERKSRMLESERRLLRQVFPPSTWNVIPKRVFGCFWVSGWVDWEISVFRLSRHWQQCNLCWLLCPARSVHSIRTGGGGERSEPAGGAAPWRRR